MKYSLLLLSCVLFFSCSHTPKYQLPPVEELYGAPLDTGQSLPTTPAEPEVSSTPTPSHSSSKSTTYESDSEEEDAKSKGYDMGYDQGFEDAGSENYDDDAPQMYSSHLQSYFADGYRQGYEDGWIEWKNRNGDEDY